MSIIFGPINSRRFGKSLGVDLSPSSKQCNFDCLYCELKGAKVVDSFNEVVSVNSVIEAIKEALSVNKDIDYLTITANGEPTLYPHLKELIVKINSFKGDIKTLILTNSGTIDSRYTQEALVLFDSVKLSLDCATKQCFKLLDRASKEIDLDNIKNGMLEFSKVYKGELLIEVLFVEGINDNRDEIKELNSFLLELNAKRIDLSTVDRPPAYAIKPISYDILHQLSLGFSKDLPISIATKQNLSGKKYNYSSSEILNTLSMRPLSKDDIEILFSQESIDRFNKLLSSDKLITISSAGVEFFKPKESQ